MDQPIVKVKNFRMNFGSKTVIENLSFDVKRGEIFGFLGANGSGKTTTLRALLDVYQPSAGELTIRGSRFNASMVGMLGYLPEERGLYAKEKVIDTMTYFGQLKGLSRAEARKKSLAYLERAELADKAKVKLNKLSGGQQQKIQLGVTIVNDPELLILDEPTKGLDPINRSLLMSIIEEHHQKGATVMMVTHQMEEVERLCDRIVLLKDGKRRLYGGVEEVRNSYGESVLAVKFDGDLPKNPDLYTITKKLPKYAELEITGTHTPQEVLKFLVNQNLTLHLFEKRQASLEDIFVQVYKEERKENEAA